MLSTDESDMVDTGLMASIFLGSFGLVTDPLTAITSGLLRTKKIRV